MLPDAQNLNGSAGSESAGKTLRRMLIDRIHEGCEYLRKNLPSKSFGRD